MMAIVSFDHLKLFRDIGQTRSVTRGAQLNGMSQSAASQHIQELEKSFAVELLDRRTRPLTLTHAGRLYLDLCKDVLRKQEQFSITISQFKLRTEGVARVASIYSVGLSEMSNLEAEYHARFPEAQLRVDYLRPEKVYAAIEEDRADLGLVSYPEPAKEIAVIPWRREEMVVAVSPNNPLARASELRPLDLAGLDFIGFDDELPIRREVDRFLRENGVEVNQTLHFDNLQMIKEAVAIGSGVSIVPARVLQAEIAMGRIVAVPLVAPGLERPLGIIYRRRKKFNRATQAFLDLLQEAPAAEMALAGV
jgi:DNA-binding transcriptional LysR family regulator